MNKHSNAFIAKQNQMFGLNLDKIFEKNVVFQF